VRLVGPTLANAKSAKEKIQTPVSIENSVHARLSMSRRGSVG